MLAVLLVFLFLLITFLLICILISSSEEDRQISDIEQEKFIKEYRERTKNPAGGGD